MSKRDDAVDTLNEAAESRPFELIRALCISMASFISEIDYSSTLVADYLEQRLGPVLLYAYRNGGIKELERAVADARKSRGTE